MNAAGLIAKLDKALNRFAPAGRMVYKRVYTASGNVTLGRATTTHVDTLLSPQPYYTRLGRERVPGTKARSETLLDSSGSAVLADDYEFVLSPTSISLTDLQNKNMVLVFKDSAGNEETLRLLDYEYPDMSGADVMYVGYFRSTKRP